MKTRRNVIPLVLIGMFMVSFIWLRALFISAGITNGSIKGIALDSKGELFIGTSNQMVVMQDGKEIRSFLLPIDDNYCFLIENDNLLIASQRSCFAKVLDLYGNHISDSMLTFEDLKESANVTIKADGKTYTIIDKSFFKQKEIQCDNVTIYKMSVVDCLFSDRVFYPLNAVFFICYTICLFRLLKKRAIRK